MKPSNLKYTEQEYIEHDPFFGEDAEIACRTVKLVKVRKPHECFFGLNGDGHKIDAGQLARYEKALVDSSFWGSYRICIPCMDRELAALRGEDAA